MNTAVLVQKVKFDVGFGVKTGSRRGRSCTINDVAGLPMPKRPNQGDVARKRVLAVQLLVESVPQGVQVA